MIKSLTQIPNRKIGSRVQGLPIEVPVDETMLRKCSYGAGMKEFTLIKPEHLLNGECFYAEKYPKGKATAHWAMKKN